MKQQFLKVHLEKLADSLLAQAERARAGSGHGTIIGTSIEVVLRRLLAEYLPSVFAVGCGQAANVSQVLSPQLDVILYCRGAFPHLAVNEDDSVVVCCESVLSVVESKTRWNRAEVEGHFQKFRHVDKGRIGWYANPEQAAAYFVFLVEGTSPDVSCIADPERPVGVYSLEGRKSWYSPLGRADFEQTAGNSLEAFLSHSLDDAMKKGPGETGTLEETHKVVAQYFGWTSL